MDRMLISSWLAERKNTEFYIANFAADDKADDRIAVIFNDSEVKKRDSERDSIFKYTRMLTYTLDKLGIGYRIMSDMTLSADRLKNTKLVIIPFSPNLDEKAAETLANFAKNGGKLAIFYIMPSKLEDVTGIKFDHITKIAVERTPADKLHPDHDIITETDQIVPWNDCFKHVCPFF